MCPLPTGYDVVDSSPDALKHHPDVSPQVLKTRQYVYLPYRVWCPACGYFVSSSTKKDAIDLWDSNILDGTAPALDCDATPPEAI